ncbi:phosphoglycolate phosphatase [Spirochaetia bacterium]|nr:phosphoglycolate phosphatase [Spirochaetia bacterium]
MDSTVDQSAQTSRLTKIEAIAFDLDGTLYPNYRLNIRLIPFVLKEWRLLVAFDKARSTIRAQQEQTVPGTPAPPFPSFYQTQSLYVAQLLGANPDQIKEKIDRLIYRGWEPFFKHIKLFSHVKETLTALREAGFKMGLLSDFPPETKLENLGIAGYWDAVLCSELCGALKPHPRSFQDLAAALNTAPERILYVGNSYRYDVIGAKQAGMRTALITNPLTPRRRSPAPDFTFHDYRQLRDFVLQFH